MGGGGSKTSMIRTTKMLLLGCANVGKGTIFTQMRLLHLQGFPEGSKRRAKECIVRGSSSSPHLVLETQQRATAAALAGAINRRTIAYHGLLPSPNRSALAQQTPRSKA